MSEAEFETPMMLQYLELKRQYPDCLLLFRLGDFYELFLEDAKTGAQVLNITLTSRSRGKDGKIPMAGVPYHALDTYLAKLIQAGYKVAICDQLSPPGKGLVDRQVTRVITPGTFVESQPGKRRAHYLLVMVPQATQVSWCAIDIGTGQTWYDSSPYTVAGLDGWLAEIVAHFEPQECVLPPAKTKPETWRPGWERAWSRYPQVKVADLPSWPSWSTPTSRQLQTTWFQPVKQALQSEPEVAKNIHQVLKIAWHYLSTTQKTAVTHLQTPTRWHSAVWINLPRSTITNLELFKTLHDGQVTGSVFAHLETTATAMGTRLLRQWLAQPLCDLSAITARQSQVAWWFNHSSAREQLRTCLRQLPDIERVLARLTLGLGNPRDLQSLSSTLATLRELIPILLASPKAPPENTWQTQLQVQFDTLADDLPTDPRQGGVFRTGVDAQLDEWRGIISTHQTWMHHFEQQLRTQTGISSLKIRYNQVFGYYIEISKANLNSVPAGFERTQTLVNAERFTTQELAAHEQALLAAKDQIGEREAQLFQNLLTTVLAMTPDWQNLARYLAELDVVSALAEVATLHRYVQPTLTTTGEIHIKGGRHPVIEQLLPPGQFVPNDVTLSPGGTQVMLLTGPNMAGKSVLMRQVALISLLAQIGSFVPADSATLSIVDQIFVRSGASDRISAGQSTFMVEMAETATIVNQATAQSLIVMDEIGRGTSTYDGISIAWAVVEYLVTRQPGPKTLFATHYHELQALAKTFPTHIANYHLAIANTQAKPVFLYQLEPGGASHSFGLAVAELAGLPNSIITKAAELLHQLETEGNPAKPASEVNQVVETAAAQWHQELAELKPETLTPLAALNLVADWKKRYT